MGWPATATSCGRKRKPGLTSVVSGGLKFKEVVAKLFLSERTIKYHMGQILERLHLKNRAQVVEYARHAGWTG